MTETGRPSLYTPEIATVICERLADGESLRSICRPARMPAERTVRRWALSNQDGFAAQYARAREIGYHCMAEEVISIADDGSNDTVVDENGNRRTNFDVVQRSRLRVDARRWFLSKCLPKIYGDKSQIEHSGGMTLLELVQASMKLGEAKGYSFVGNACPKTTAISGEGEGE